MSAITSRDVATEINYTPWLPEDKDAEILDLGCGDGRLLRFLSAHGHTRIHGVDRDVESLAVCQGLPGVTTECTEVGPDYLRRQRSRFRLIILRQVIYYVGRDAIVEFMHALRDALADDGVVVIEFFNGSLLSSRLTEIKDPFIRTAYTEHSMRRLLVACGFQVRHIGPELRQKSRLRSYVYLAMRHAWTSLLRLIYILERGYDGEIPKIYTKSVIAAAGRRSDV